AEAVAAGTPVVVTEKCGIAPLLKDVAGLVVAHDAGAVAAAMHRLLTDSQLHGQFAASCAALTARLGWEQPVAEMENLYASLMTASESGAAPRAVE
ncbi:MAG: glycosyltransferase, partial [Candidatus Acidiferrum sp.]